MIKNRTDALKTDLNLLIFCVFANVHFEEGEMFFLERDSQANG